MGNETFYWDGLMYPAVTKPLDYLHILSAIPLTRCQSLVPKVI